MDVYLRHRLELYREILDLAKPVDRTDHQYDRRSPR